MKKVMQRLAGAAIISATTLSSVYAEDGGGRILGYIPYTSGGKEVLIVRTENLTGSRPGCNSSARFAISSANVNFKSTQSAIMAAMASGARVYIRGQGTCSAWGNAEDFSYVCIGDISC